jgi:hypothetical protein
MHTRWPSYIAIVILSTLVSVASPASGSSIGTPPDPDVILIFRPHDDHLFSVVDEVVRGDILRVEKGVAPRLIVTPAGTLGPAWQAGVPIRLSLMKFADRDAHYPIFADRAPAPKPPAIAVSASDGLATIHAAPPGSPIVMEAMLTVPDAESTARVDVYLGVVPPGGESLSWVVGTYSLPTMVSSAAPVPYLVDFPVYPATFRLSYRSSVAEARGWHTLYGLIVRAGANPLDPLQWISTSLFPFLVTPPAITSP